MNLHKVKDSLELEKSIVFHSTASKEELADILLKKEFSAGRGGGKMLGPGFYANQHLYQAKKHNYGHYYDFVDRFCVPSQLFCREVKGTFRPTTKEQKEFLFQKMRKAGYEWDKDKKELIKL